MIVVMQDMQGMSLNGSRPSQVVFRLIVPNANCGSLIGKGGNNIRELREVAVAFHPYLTAHEGSWSAY